MFAGTLLDPVPGGGDFANKLLDVKNKRNRNM